MVGVSCRLDLLVALTHGGKDIKYFEEAIGLLCSIPILHSHSLIPVPLRSFHSRMDARGNIIG